MRERLPAGGAPAAACSHDGELRAPFRGGGEIAEAFQLRGRFGAGNNFDDVRAETLRFSPEAQQLLRRWRGFKIVKREDQLYAQFFRARADGFVGGDRSELEIEVARARKELEEERRARGEREIIPAAFRRRACGYNERSGELRNERPLFRPQRGERIEAQFEKLGRFTQARRAPQIRGGRNNAHDFRCPQGRFDRFPLCHILGRADRFAARARVF